MKKADIVFRLPASVVGPWLARRGWSVSHIAERRKVWRTASGELVALTEKIVEDSLAFEDPVCFMRLNLIEPRDVLDSETGAVVVPKGSPWVLMPKQERMARLAVNAVFECGAETGKTRNIIGRALWKCATRPGSKILIACANQVVADEIGTAAEWQCEQNPTIGNPDPTEFESGLKGKLKKSPFYGLSFLNDSEIQLRLVGAQGEQLRGFHGTDLFGDECALWRSVKCFTELYRAGEPGALVQLFSTHNGDRASAWYGIVSRARPIDGREDERFEETIAGEAEPGFVKLRIAKPDLPLLWGPKRKAEAVALYGGETTSAYRQNVMGEVGDPTTTIFPASLLEPCLSRTLDAYRLVVAEVDREAARARVRVSRLSGSRTAAAESLVADEDVPALSDWDFGRFLASFFPATADMVEPRLYAGADLGSEKDPTEVIFARVEGPRWTDLFRLHLSDAKWPMIAAAFASIDCASGHRVRYGADSGSAGAFLAQSLRGREFESCPICRKDSHLSERFFGFNFGEVVDDTDPDTGEPVVDPEKRDNAGHALARRLSRKEYATRILEAKVQRRELVLADDDGAGDTRLGVSALMRGVSQVGVTSRGERRFDGRNDHHADARRQLALIIARDARDGFGGGEPPADPALMAGIRRDGSIHGGSGREVDPYRAVGSEPFGFGMGGVGRGLRGDW